ncbi:hypothetical protein SETIT_9G326000v2 [Setaria italica]|uniref:GATA-type domain-containing protein n=1 Tax=Setaria italica TaxID=4555 RepID=K4AMC5_SETIT|nr:hypothetical protein SETIT_9G326000v2 [Setaria italica]
MPAGESSSTERMGGRRETGSGARLRLMPVPAPNRKPSHDAQGSSQEKPTSSTDMWPASTKNLGSMSHERWSPYDQLAELEWLSNYMGKDNFPTEDLKKLQIITSVPPASSTDTAMVFVSAPVVLPDGGVLPPEAPVPGKASRLLVLPPPPVSPPSPAFAAISPSESGTTAPAFPAKKPLKPAKKKEPSTTPEPNATTVATAASAGEGRKCLHCETNKTPQWRTGPLGPKTLCNACGVWYKSGRLVLEYRLAASLTFVVSKHSNSHRKVLELHRQKEAMGHMGAGATGGLMHTPSPLLFDEPTGPLIGNDFLIHNRIGLDFRQLI